MNRPFYLLIITAILFVTGCSEPKIDASSDDAMKKSTDKVRLSLPEDKRAAFDQALGMIAMSQIDFKDIMAGKTGADMAGQKVKDAINGKTGKEVLAKADLIIAERKQKEKEQALQEIKELEELKQKSETSAIELDKFQIIKSRFYKDKDRFSGYNPIIELTVKNGTEHAVSRAYFNGTIASPGRSVPWLVENFNYEIPGGIEPNEEKSWTLAPNSFGVWGTVNAPDDAVFTVKTVQIDGPDKKELFASDNFTDKHEERLKKLKKEYGVTQ